MKNLNLILASEKTNTLSGFLLFILFLTVIMGCDDTPTEVTNYSPEAYLSAFLENGTPVHEVWLERLAPLEEYYDPSTTGERNAQITIYEVNGDSLQMVEDPDSLGWGRYIPAPGQSLTPESFRDYRIRVVTSSNEILEAQTSMPGTIDSASVVLIDLETMEFREVQEGDTLTREDPNLYFIWKTVEGAGGYVDIKDSLNVWNRVIPQ